MFAINCAVIFLYFIFSINAEISEAPEIFEGVEIPPRSKNSTKYKKLIEVKTKYNDIVDGRILPIFGVFEDYNTTNHEIVIELNVIYMLLMNYGIEEIQPGAFENVRGNIDLFLNQNEIKTIRKGIFNHNQGILILDLNDNKISFIEDGAFDNMPRLLRIRLSNNRLKSWNRNWFANTPKLTTLWFHNNSIEEFPAYAFKNLGGLIIIADDIFGLKLYFNNNNIKKIDPTAFKGIYSLDYLQLSNNSIQNFPSTLLTRVIVHEIDLRGNNISCIPKSSDYTERTTVQPSLCEK